MDLENGLKEVKEMETAGWVASFAPAVKSEDSNGTRGGAVLLHRPWLKTAIPVEATGESGRVLPQDDIDT